MNVVVFCSGNGSNFQAIADAVKKGIIRARIALMVCDDPRAYAVKRAKKLKIKTLVAERKNFLSRDEFERYIVKHLKKEKIELICLAGYMRILSDDFIAAYKNRIINIHPALLPSFKGSHGIKDALDYDVKVTGVTVHFVTKDVDSGPVILQEPVKVYEGDTEDSLARRIHKIEHKLYPEAVRLFIEKRLKITGRKVKILASAIMLLLAFGFSSEAVVEKTIPALLEKNAERFSFGLKQEIPIRENAALQKVAKEIAPILKVKKAKDDASAACRKLSLSADLSPRLKEAELNGLKENELINPGSETYRPQSKEEIENMRISGSLSMAERLADRLRSMDLEFASDGVNNLIDTAKKAISFREYLRQKLNLHFRVDKDEAIVRYKKKF